MQDFSAPSENVFKKKVTVASFSLNLYSNFTIYYVALVACHMFNNVIKISLKIITTETKIDGMAIIILRQCFFFLSQFGQLM